MVYSSNSRRLEHSYRSPTRTKTPKIEEKEEEEEKEDEDDPDFVVDDEVEERREWEKNIYIDHLTFSMLLNFVTDHKFWIIFTLYFYFFHFLPKHFNKFVTDQLIRCVCNKKVEK